MTQAMLTFVAPLAVTRLAEAEAAIDALGNPTNDDVEVALKPAPGEEEGTHFCSLHALRTTDGRAANIVFEISADGTEEAATERIARTLGPHLKPVLMLASDWPGGDVAAYLAAHSVSSTTGCSATPASPSRGRPASPSAASCSSRIWRSSAPGSSKASGWTGGPRRICWRCPPRATRGRSPWSSPRSRRCRGSRR